MCVTSGVQMGDKQYVLGANVESGCMSNDTAASFIPE